MPKFELDPRRPEDRSKPDAWEDVGNLDRLDMKNFMQVLRKEHGVSVNKKSQILEVGIGKGRLFSRLKSEGYFVTGVEARKRPEHHEGLPVANIRIEEMPFDKDTAQFDMIIASSVFDDETYNQDKRQMIERIADALRSGGVLICGYIADWSDEIPNHARLRKLKFSTPGYEYMLAYKKV